MRKYEGLKEYAIQFLYSDNRELYDDRVLLTYEEYVKIYAYLKSLLEVNVIQEASATDPKCVDYVIWPINPCEPLSFKELVANWTGNYLIDVGKEFGLVL